MGAPRRTYGNKLSRLARLLSEEPEETGLRKVGRYRILREIGRGGMGVVYEAEDPELRRRVALKILLESEASPPLIKRLHREAAIAAQLDHPNIVGVHEVSMVKDETGRPIHFIAMVYIEGRSLADHLQAGDFDLTERLRLLEEVTRAVAYAHDKGVIHRDLKPANILVDGSGRAQLTDFGLARGDMFQSDLTRSAAVIGTPHYMAPEQVQGKQHEIGPESDVYALGIILYQCLTGRTPFEGGTVMELYNRILDSEPERPAKIRPETPRDLDVICLKAISKERDRRYPAAEKLAEDIARYRNGETISARPSTFLYRWRKRFAKRKAILLASLAAILLLIAVSILLPVLLDQMKATRSAERSVRLWREVSTVLSSADRMSREGEMERSRERIEEGLALCRDALKEGELAEAHYFRARLLRRKLDREGALLELDEAIRLNANFPEARFERGRVRVELYVMWMDSNRQAFGVVEQRTPEPAGMTALREGALTDLEGTIGPSTFYEEADALHTRAELHRIRGDLDEARKALEKIRRLDPTHAETLVSLSRIQFDRKDFPRAHASADRAVKLNEGLASAYIRRCIASFWMAETQPHSPERGRRYSEALADIELALRLGEKSALTHAARGMCLAVHGRHEEALRDFERAIDLNPLYGIAYNGQANVFRMTGRLVDATESYTLALQIQPDSAPTLLNRAATLVLLGRDDEARDDVDRALQLDASQYRGHLLLGQLALRREDWEEALQQYDKVLREHPERILTHIDRGRVLVGMKRDDEALKEFRRVLKAVPDNAAALMETGEVLRRQGKKEEARKTLNRAVEKNPEEYTVYGYRAAARLDWGELTGAEQDLSRMIAMRPLDAMPWHRRGQVRIRRQQWRSGITDLDEAIRLRPGYIDPYLTRGLAHARCGNLSLAVKDFNVILKLDPNHINARINRGATYAQLSLFREALEDISYVIERRPKDAEALAMRAKIRNDSGDRIGAREDARKSIDLGVGSPMRELMDALLKN